MSSGIRDSPAKGSVAGPRKRAGPLRQGCARPRRFLHYWARARESYETLVKFYADDMCLWCSAGTPNGSTPRRSEVNLVSFYLFASQRNDRIDAGGANRGDESGESGSEGENAYSDRGGDGIFRIHPEEQTLN